MGQPEACSGAERSPRRASWPKPELSCSRDTGAAEIWQLKSELAARAASSRDGPARRVLVATTPQTRVGSFLRQAVGSVGGGLLLQAVGSCSVDGELSCSSSTHASPSTAATAATAATATAAATAPATVPAADAVAALPSGWAAAVARLAGRTTRWLDGGGGSSHAALQARADAARTLAAAIRLELPQLPQTTFEASKVAHNTQVALAMLEAYSRVLANQTQIAIVFYARLASHGGRASLTATPSSVHLLPKGPSGLDLPMFSTVDASAGAAAAADAGGSCGAAALPSVALVPEEESCCTSTPASAAPLLLHPVAKGEAAPGNPREGFNTLTAHDMAQHKWAISKREIEFVTRLGAGAFGEVWAGTWRRNDVAVKSLHVSDRLSEDDKNNFLEEMSLLSELRHPNIVRFLGACLEASDMCILFEMCPGSLYEYLHKHDDPMPETPLLVKMFREVSAGIYYLT